MKISYLLMLFCFLISTTINAQLNPVKWEHSAKKISEEEYEITFVANITHDWNIYSQFTDPGGPVPTSFNFEENSNIEFIGTVSETGKKKEAFDDLFGVNVIKFSGLVTFTQKVKVKNGVDKISGYLEFMCCDDEKCLPPKEVDFQILLK